jgi:hypothetical protein
MYGVPLDSYWFGFLSFITVLVILFFTYFVLRGGIRENLSEDDYIDTSYEIPNVGIIASKTIPATQSRTAFVGMLSLIFSEIFFCIIFFIGVFLDFNQNVVAMSLAMAFIFWGFILDLYRREFLPYVLIKKNRKEKMIPEREFKYKTRRTPQ